MLINCNFDRVAKKPFNGMIRWRKHRPNKMLIRLFGVLVLSYRIPVIFLFIWLGGGAHAQSHVESRGSTLKENREPYCSLDASYKHHSEAGKECFFREWKAASDSMIGLDSINDGLKTFLKNVYRVFTPDTNTYAGRINLYKSWRSPKFDEQEAKRSADYAREEGAFCFEAKYIITQPYIEVELCNKEEYDGPILYPRCKYRKTTIDYMPSSFYPGKPILVLSEKYKAILNDFLMKSTLANPTNKSRQEIKRRREYLRPTVDFLTPTIYDADSYYCKAPTTRIRINQDSTRIQLFSGGTCARCISDVSEIQKREFTWGFIDDEIIDY